MGLFDALLCCASLVIAKLGSAPLRCAPLRHICLRKDLVSYKINLLRWSVRVQDLLQWLKLADWDKYFNTKFLNLRPNSACS